MRNCTHGRSVWQRFELHCVPGHYRGGELWIIDGDPRFVYRIHSIQLVGYPLFGFCINFPIFVYNSFRNKYPDDCRYYRNRAVGTVLACILLTLLLSFVNFMDGAAHVGGLLAGLLSGMFVLAGELDGAIFRVGGNSNISI